MKISEGKKKDLILEYIIERERGNQPKSASSEEIKNDVLPNSSIEEITILLKEIEMHNPELVKFYFGITTTYSTKIIFAQPFLKKGGFEKLEKEEIKQNIKNTFDFNVSKFQYYTFWPIFIFAFIGFGFSVSNFIKDQKNQKNTEIQKQRIDKMELELTKLHTSISNRKNIDSFRNPKVLTKKKDKKE